jgi:hypothetical protein
VAFSEASSWTVKRILENGLEAEPLMMEVAPPPVKSAAFARMADEIFLDCGGDHHG